jgi:hypothetical protein
MLLNHPSTNIHEAVLLGPEDMQQTGGKGLEAGTHIKHVGVGTHGTFHREPNPSSLERLPGGRGV